MRFGPEKAEELCPGHSTCKPQEWDWKWGPQPKTNTFLIQHPAPYRERFLSGPPRGSDLVLGLSKAVTFRAMRRVPNICTGGDSKVITNPNLLFLALWMGATGPAES